MDTKIYNLIILDESGSMCVIKKAAVNSVNETLQTIRKAEKDNKGQKHYVTLVTFNNVAKTIFDCEECSKVKDLDIDEYQPQCNTALYDAMGQSINELKQKVTETDRVLVTVITDGYENASIEYSGKAIKKLVEEMKEKGWVFAYIGANHDVKSAATNISITNVINFEATDKGTAFMSMCVNRSRERLYSIISDHEFDAITANKNFFD